MNLTFTSLVGKLMGRSYPSEIEVAVEAAAERDPNNILENIDVVVRSMSRVSIDEDLETLLLEFVNRKVPESLGPWSLRSEMTSGGVLIVRYHFAGPEVEEDTEYPGTTYEDHVSLALKSIGASGASCRASLEHTPRSWGFDGGERLVVSYEGKATFPIDASTFLRASLGEDKIAGILWQVQKRSREASTKRVAGRYLVARALCECGRPAVVMHNSLPLCEYCAPEGKDLMSLIPFRDSKSGRVYSRGSIIPKGYWGNVEPIQ
jgi:hypothetical protein